MTWVSWRLLRTEALIVAGIFILLALFLVPTGIQMANAYDHNGLGACASASQSVTCGAALGDFRQRFESLLDTASWFTLVPGLIGVLLAAPFTIDLERGTYRLAWTQSITRGRWLVGKLGLPALAALAAGIGVELLFRWWRTPSIHIDGRLATATYDTTGIVVIGYTVFAFALAVALGALWRRSAASLAVGFVAYFAVRIFVDYVLRDHLVAPLTATYRGRHQPDGLVNAHIISMTGWLHGHQVIGGSGFFLGSEAKFAAPNAASILFHVVYQPESHYWPLQLTETGLFVGTAALLLLFTAWWTKQRAS